MRAFLGQEMNTIESSGKELLCLTESMFVNHQLDLYIDTLPFKHTAPAFSAVLQFLVNIYVEVTPDCEIGEWLNHINTQQ